MFGKKLDNGNVIDISYIKTEGKNGNGVARLLFSGVITDQDGITETWSWTLKCRGCGREHPASPSERKNAHGQCQECGADLRLIKK